MRFEDIEKSDLKKLNLSMLRGVWSIQRLIGAGEVYVYRPRNGRIIFSKEETKGARFRIKIDNFEDITEEQFLNVLGLTETATSKYIWLQKYLRGEVSGKYSEEDKEDLIKISVRKAVEKEEEKINKLKEKIKAMSDEITELKDENNRLKDEIKKYEKVKKAIKEIQEIDL